MRFKSASVSLIRTPIQRAEEPTEKQKIIRRNKEMHCHLKYHESSDTLLDWLNDCYCHCSGLSNFQFLLSCCAECRYQIELVFWLKCHNVVHFSMTIFSTFFSLSLSLSIPSSLLLVYRAKRIRWLLFGFNFIHFLFVLFGS